MALTTAEKLTNLGVNYVLAGVLGNARDNGTTLNADKVSAHGVPGPLAIELVRQINAQSFRSDYLATLGFPTEAARALVEGVGAVSPLALNAAFSQAGTSYQAGGYGYVNDNNQGYAEKGLVVPAMEFLGNPLRMTFNGNKAVSGSVASQIQSTIAATLATMPAGGLVIVDGFVNDESASTPATTVNGYVDQIVSAVLADAKGHRLLLLPGHPLQTAWGDGRDAIRTAVNAYMATKAGPRVKVFNSDALGFVSGDYADQLHLNSQGSDKYGLGLKAFLAASGWMPTGATKDAAGTVYLDNPTLTGGTTTPSGNWSLSSTNAGGATVVGSKVGGKWRITVSGTYTGNGKFINLQNVGSGSGFPAAGDYIEGLASYTIVSTPTNLLTVNLIAEAFSAGFANTLVFAQSGTAFDQLPSTRASGLTCVTKTPQTKVDSVAAAAFIGVEARINLPNAASSTVVDIVIDFDHITCRKCI